MCEVLYICVCVLSVAIEPHARSYVRLGGGIGVGGGNWVEQVRVLIWEEYPRQAVKVGRRKGKLREPREASLRLELRRRLQGCLGQPARVLPEGFVRGRRETLTLHGIGVSR